MKTTAQQAFDSLDPQAWAETPIVEKLALIKQIQDNLTTYAEELGIVDAKMKNDLIGENIISVAEGMASTVMPMAGTLMGIQRLYESLVKGKMPEAIKTEKIDNDLYEIQVFPIHSKDKMAAQK